MTLRSDRRILELQIIDAARLLARRNDADEHIQRLQALIGKLDHLELEAASKALHPAKGPITSQQAAESMTNIGPLAYKVLINIATTEHGLTCDEIEKMMDGKHQTISARVNELRDKGWIKDSGQRRPTRSGRNAIVWIPSYEASNQMRRPAEW